MPFLAIAVAAFVVLFGGWALNGAVGYADPIFLPAPEKVLSRVGTLIDDGSLWEDVRVSFVRVTIGFLISTGLAIPIGLLMGAYRWSAAAFSPSLEFARYMPVSAFVPLSIIWLGIGESQKWLIIFLGTFFVQALMIMDDVKRVPQQQLEVAYTFGLNGPAVLRRVMLPSAAPAIWDTLRITLGWAWTWVILAELVNADAGLGARVVQAQRLFQTETIFVVLIVVGFLGLFMDQAMRFAGTRLFPGAAAARGAR